MVIAGAGDENIGLVGGILHGHHAKATPDFALSAYVLIGAALLLAATASEALNTGIGLLMFISGVELIYAPLEPSVSVAVLLGFMTLALGVALSYLTLADVADRARAPS